MRRKLIVGLALFSMLGAGIINGKTIGTVNPEDNATRAEIDKFKSNNHE